MFLFRIKIVGATDTTSNQISIKNMTFGSKAVRYSRDYGKNVTQQIEQIIIGLLREVYPDIIDSDPNRFYITYTARDSDYSYYVAKPI